MSRKRSITSAMGADERIEQIAEKDQLSAMMWPWLLTAFDDWGRLDITSIGKIRLEIFPAFPKVKNATIDKAISAYSDAGMLHRYSVGERKYIAIRPSKWIKWQTYLKGTKRASADSSIPEPNDAPWSATENNELILWLTKPEERSKLPTKPSISGRAEMSADISGHSGLSVPSPSPSPSPSEKEINNAYAREGDAEEVDEAVEGELPPGQQYRCFQEYNLLICPLGIGAMEMLNSFLKDGLEDDMICAVLEECNANDGRSIGYVQKALQGSLELGIKTLAQYQEHLSRWKERSFKGGRQSQAPPQREIIPMTPEEKQALEEVMRNGRRKVNNSS